MAYDNDLLIKIGADTKGFDRAVAHAQQTYQKLYDRINSPTNKQSQNSMKNLFNVREFSKTMRKVEAAAEATATEVKAQIASALNITDTKEIDRYYRQWERESRNQVNKEERNAKRITQMRIREVRKYMASKEGLSKKAYDKEWRRIRNLSLKEMQELNKRAKAKSKYDNGVNWNGHNPLRTVAVYGLATKIVYELAAAFKAGGAAVVAFDAMVHQNMGVLQVNREEATKLALTVETLGVRYGTAFADIQEAMITLGRAGVSSEDIGRYTESVLALAQITGDTLGESAEAVASYREVFRKAAGDVEFFGGKMAYIANETVLSMANFKIMGNYALSASKNMGMTYDTLLSLMGAMSKVGKQSSTIGTTIRRLGTSLKDNSDKVITAWRKMGFEQEKVAKAMHTNSDATTKAITKNLAAMSNDEYRDATRDLNVLMKDLFDTMRDIGKSGGEAGSFFEQFSKSYVDAIKQAEEVSASFTANIQKMENWFLKLATTISIDALSAINDFIGKLKTETPQAIASAEMAFKGFGKLVLRVLAAIIAGLNVVITTIGVAFGGLMKISGKLDQGVGSVLGGITKEDYTEAENRFNKFNTMIAEGSKKHSKLALDNAKNQTEKFKKVMVEYYSDGAIQTLTRDGAVDAEWGQTFANNTYIAGAAIHEVMKDVDAILKGTGKLEKALSGATPTLKKDINGKPIGDLSADTSAPAALAASLKMQNLLNRALKGEDVTRKIVLAKMDAEIAKQTIIAKAATEAAVGKEKYEKATLISAKANEKLLNLQLARKKELAKNGEQDARASEAASKKKERATNSAAKAGEASRRRAIRDYEKMTEAQMKLAEQEHKQTVLKDKIEAGGSGNMSKSKEHVLKIKFMKMEAKHLASIARDYKKKATTDKLKQKAAEAYTKQLDKQLKILDEQNKFASRFASSFEALFSGDLVGAFEGFGKNIMSELNIEDMATSWSKLLSSMLKGFVDFNAAMDAALISSVWGIILFLGTKILSSIMGDDFKYEDVGTKYHETGADITGIMEHMDWAMTRTMKYSGGMLDNLQALVRASGQAARGLVSSGYTFQSVPDMESSGFLGFNSKSIKTHEQGLRFGGVTAANLEAMKAYLFSSGETTKKKFWGLSSKTKQWYTEHEAPDEVTQGIIRAYQSGIKAVLGANDLLKMGDNNQLLKGFHASSHKINFEGMSQADISKAIEGAIGSDLDKWVRSYAGWVDELAQGAETALETYMRVAYEFEAVQQIFADLGSTLNVFKENGVMVSDAFIKASGGLSNALSNVEGYIENFYDEEEKQKLRAEQIMRGSKVLPKDAEAYRKKIEELTADAGGGDIKAAKLLAEMLRQQQLYYDYYEVIKAQNEEIKVSNEEALAIQQENLDRELEWQNTRLAFYKDIESKIKSAYTGTLSYLNFVEKADFMGRMAQSQFEAGDTQGYFDSLGKQLEYEKKMALTKEEYALKFDSYISELQSAEPEKTTDDIVESIESLIVQNIRIEDAIANSSYQTPIH